MLAATKTAKDKFKMLEKELVSKRDEIRGRFANQLAGVAVEREPDDECAEANHNLNKHLILSILDRDRFILNDIELALKRIRAGSYGMCDTCGGAIPDARLRALPWARSCLQCAERAS
jgi:DnaK suppressor protein